MILRERGQMGKRGAACQGNAGGGQRTHGENDLALGRERIGSCGNLVIHDLVGDAHTADVLLVWVGGFGRDDARAQVDAGDFAGPTERNVVFFCHCNSPSLL